jgi:hypothetical protein
MFFSCLITIGSWKIADFVTISSFPQVAAQFEEESTAKGRRGQCWAMVSFEHVCISWDDRLMGLKERVDERPD